MSKLVMAGQRLTGEGFAGPHSGHRTPLPGTEVHSTGRGITAGAVLRSTETRVWQPAWLYSVLRYPQSAGIRSGAGTGVKQTAEGHRHQPPPVWSKCALRPFTTLRQDH